jgi:tetratricopeptide (TPR) repeat protein
MKSRFGRCLDGFLEAGWLTALIAVPLFFNTQTARTFEPDKLALLRMLAIVMAAVWLVRWLDGRGWRRWRCLGRRPLELPVTMLVVAYIAATALSVDPATSWFGSYQRGQGAYTLLAYVTIFGVMATTLREPAQLERVFAVIIATTVPVALYVIVQRHGLDPLPWSTDVQRRAGGQLGNPIFAAGYLIMVVPLTLARAIPALTHLVRTDRWSPAETTYAGVLLMALALQLTAIALTLARGPWVSLALGLLLFLLLLLASATTAAATSRRPALRDAMLSSAIGLALVLVPLALVGRFLDSSASPAGSLLTFLGVSGVLIAAVVVVHGYRHGVQRVLVDLVVFVLLGSGLLIALNTVPEPDAGVQENSLTADLRRTLHDWRGVPALNRMVRLTEWDRGTGRVRVLIWEGVLDLLTDREPLRQADGTPDRFAAMRPLIGYGPESMQLVYHRHFPTDLATVERRGRFPDRAHNELYDVLITTGLVGLLAWHLLFFAAFRYGLQRLGLLRGRRHGYAFLACWIGGAAVSAAALVKVLGPPYLGVAVPLGMLAGLGCYLLGFAVLAREGSVAATRGPAADRLLTAGLLAAISAHMMEIHMGIATATTRLYFFICLALLLSSGLAFRRQQCVRPPDHENPSPRLEKTGATLRPVVRTLTELLSRVLLLGLVLGASIIPFLYWNPIEQGWAGRLDALPTAMQMLRNVLAAGPVPASAGMPVLLVFVLVPAWVLGALLLQAPGWWNGAMGRSATPGRSVGPPTGAYFAFVTLGGAAVALLLAYWQASLLREALSASWTVSERAGGVAGPVRIAESIAGYARYAPLTLAGIGALLGAVLALRRWAGQGCLRRPAAMVAAVLLPAVVYLAATTNLGSVRADAIHKQAVAAGQLPADGAPGDLPGETLRASEAAVAIGQRAVAAMPREEVYRLFLAYALTVLGERVDEPPRRAELMQQAREHLEVARAMHPFSPAPSANLARWHARWAEIVPGEARSPELAAAILHYREAIGLSPRDAPLRNEYARLLVRAGEDCLQALEALRVSVEVDPHLAETYFLQAAQATACAEAAGAAERVRLRNEVIESLATGLRLEPENPRRLMLAAEIHMRWEGDAGLAMARHEEARMLGTEDYPAWRMDVAMAQWSLDRGDPVQAARYGRLALEDAPPAVKHRLMEFLRQLPDLPEDPSP